MTEGVTRHLNYQFLFECTKKSAFVHLSLQNCHISATFQDPVFIPDPRFLPRVSRLLEAPEISIGGNSIFYAFFDHLPTPCRQTK